MKKLFNNAEIEIIKFGNADIITVSDPIINPIHDDGNENSEKNTPEIDIMNNYDL